MPKKYIKTKDIPKKDRFCRKCYRSVDSKLSEAGLCWRCEHKRTMLTHEVETIDAEYKAALNKHMRR